MRKNRYKKILNHLKSEEIDNKIKYLDEKMTTSGMYLNYGLDSGTPAVPEVPAIPAVPPTYDNVTGGLSNANDFVWPDQGDGSNPDATTSIPSNLYTTYNGQQVAATRYIDTYNGNALDYGDYPPIGALVFKDGWLGWNYLGYLSGSGIRSVGTTRFPNGDIGNAINAAYNNWPFPGLITKTIYQWEPLDCLFGSCKGASQYYPAGRTAETTPKADRALYAYTLWIPADANGNPLPNRIMTNAGSPEVSAIPGTPAIPPKQVIIGRSNIGDPNYYPGPIKVGLDFLKNIGKSLSEFGKSAEDAINKIGDNIRGVETNISNIVNGIQDGFNLLNTVKDVLGSSQSQWGPKDSDGRYTLPAGSLGTQNNPVINNVSSSTQEYLMSGYDPKIDGSIGTYLQTKTSLGIEQGGNIGAKGTHNNITGTPYIAPNGDIHIPDTYGFGPSQDAYNKPIVKQTVDIISTIAGALGGENARQQVSENVQTFFDQSLFAIIPGTPGREAPIVHFETVIPASQAQKLSPNYKNQSVKEETLFEKFKKQNQLNKSNQKVNEFDLLISAIQNIPGPIKKYLLLEFETSIKLATLSPDERRFKEKEIQNELLVKTSDLYVDTHFPENQKLFNRVQKSIKKNIKLTDPKTFKSPEGVLTYNQLKDKDFVNENKELKEKIYLKRKSLIKKLFKKEKIKTKEQIINEKINQLNKDLKKTGMAP